MSTKALRKSIVGEMSTAVAQYAPVGIYYGQAPAEHTKNYIVFVVEELTHEDYRTGCELEVNVIGYGLDTTACEDIADALQKALHGKFYQNEQIAWECYREKGTMSVRRTRRLFGEG